MSRQDLKDATFLDMAETLGGLSTCDRAGVGAIITRDGRAVSWGFNGAPPGLPHCSENDHGYSRHPLDGKKYKVEGCLNATHAEANTVAFAARQGISTEGGTLYVECSPCATCARILVAAGIKRVVFSREYRIRDGIEILEQAGVQVG
jgi:dCMP deaminase